MYFRRDLPSSGQEAWGLGGVREVHGRNLHELLHPRCDSQGCAFAQRLAQAWRELQEGEGVDFEIHDAILDRVLHATVRTMARTGLAVIVLSDVTTLHKIRNDLQGMNEQLESRIDARTRELNVSRDELSLLSAQLMTTQEDERKRIAQELHYASGSRRAPSTFTERAEEMVQNNAPGNVHDLLAMTIRRSTRRSGFADRDESASVAAPTISWCPLFAGPREFNEVYPLSGCTPTPNSLTTRFRRVRRPRYFEPYRNSLTMRSTPQPATRSFPCAARPGARRWRSVARVRAAGKCR
jgi:hypothetical protein